MDKDFFSYLIYLFPQYIGQCNTQQQQQQTCARCYQKKKEKKRFP